MIFFDDGMLVLGVAIGWLIRSWVALHEEIER